MRFDFSCIARMTLLVAMAAGNAWGQSAGVPIEEDRLSFSDSRVMEALGKLRDSKKLMSLEEVHAALEKPTPAAVKLPGASKQVLSSGQVAELARKGLIRMGWFFQTRRGGGGRAWRMGMRWRRMGWWQLVITVWSRRVFRGCARRICLRRMRIFMCLRFEGCWRRIRIWMRRWYGLTGEI